jgi:hypothetical protein
VPSKSNDLRRFLKKLKVRQGQKLVDFGSGDGQVLLLGSKEFGLHTLGYEINPYLVLVSSLRLRRQNKIAKAKIANLWRASVPSDADYLYFFILPKYIDRLIHKFQSEITRPVIVISYSFPVDNLNLVASGYGFYAYHLEPKLANKKENK